MTPNLNVAEVFGFIREKIYSTIGQPFTPAQFASFVESSTGASPAESTINTFGSNFFPGMTIVNMLGTNSTHESTTALTPHFDHRPGRGVARRHYRDFPESLHALGQRHLDPGQAHLTFGGTYSYTQLNTRDQRPGTGMIGIADLSQFLQGFVTPYTSDGYVNHERLAGQCQPLLRANETGAVRSGQIPVSSQSERHGWPAL